MFLSHAGKGRAADRGIRIVLLGFCVLVGCGTLGASDDQPKGDSNLPLSGVGPFMKQFIDCSASVLEPIFMTSGRRDVLYGEPWLVQETNSRFMLFFERRADRTAGRKLSIHMQRIEIVPAPADQPCTGWVVKFVSAQGDELAAADPVRVLKNAGAPCVLVEDGVFKIWYSLPKERGIGYTEMVEQADGSFVVSLPQATALRPSEDWENGLVGSASVLHNPMNGQYQMWYEGSINSRRSIGYAESDSASGGWVKRDAAGRNSVNNPGKVMPVLWPDQRDWEFHYPRDLESGTVGQPNVIIFQGPARTFYYMYYTGNLTGWPKPGPVKAPLEKGTLMLLNDQDSSIGFAGSLDGLTWMKASTLQDWKNVAWEVNPIINEVFPVDALDKLWRTLKGRRYREKIAGSANEFFPITIVNEMAPCTVNQGTRFVMAYQQTGGLSFKQGLGLAAVWRDIEN